VAVCWDHIMFNAYSFARPLAKLEVLDPAGRRIVPQVTCAFIKLTKSTDTLEPVFIVEVTYHHGKVFLRARGCYGIYVI